MSTMLCRCKHPESVHEAFKGKLVCTIEGCSCGQYKEVEIVESEESGSGGGDWFAELVGAALDGASKHVQSKIKKGIR